MTDLIPVDDARCYVLDTADDMLVVEFPRAVRVSRSTILEVERRLQEFVKREVIPLLREEGLGFSADQVDNNLSGQPIWTYVLFGEENRYPNTPTHQNHMKEV